MEPFVQTPLQQLYGVGDVTGIGLGQQNYQNTVDKGTLANQFDAANNPLLLQKQTLSNQFDEQNNPLRLQNSQLTNAGIGDTNRINAVKANLAEGTQQFELNKAQREDALGASDLEIKKMQNQASLWAMSDDPTLKAKGEKLMLMSQKAVEARQQQAADLAQAKETNASHERSAKSSASISAGATLGAARIGADSRFELQGMKNDAMLIKTQQMANLNQLLARTLQEPESPERNAKANSIAQALQIANPQGGGNINLGALAAGGTLSRNSDAPLFSNAPSPSGQQSGPPAGAVQMLKGNPAMRSQFDAKYGAGASSKILGN